LKFICLLFGSNKIASPNEVISIHEELPVLPGPIKGNNEKNRTIPKNPDLLKIEDNINVNMNKNMGSPEYSKNSRKRE